MAKNTNPNFLLTGLVGLAEIAAANTARDGTGTIVDLFTAAANGSRPGQIKIIAKGTTTAGIVNLFIYNAVAWKFWAQVAVTAAVPSATVKAFEGYVDPEDLETLTLETGWKLGAAPTNAEAFNVFALGASY